MGRLKGSKNKPDDIVDSGPPDDNDLAIKRDNLIEDLQSKLLSKDALNKGGRGIVAKHIKQQTELQGMLDEINELGKELGLAALGYGHIRK